LLFEEIEFILIAFSILPVWGPMRQIYTYALNKDMIFMERLKLVKWGPGP
jgi:hypothetical protein